MTDNQILFRTKFGIYGHQLTVEGIEYSVFYDGNTINYVKDGVIAITEHALDAEEVFLDSIDMM